MNEKQRKILIVVGIIAIIYILIALFFLKDDKDELNDHVVTLILTPRIRLQYHDDVWTRTFPSSTDEESIYRVYDNNAYVGDYYMMYNKYITGFNIFQKENDKKVNYYIYDRAHQILAVRKDTDINVIDFSTKDMTDLDTLKDILNNVGISSDMENLYRRQVEIDYDNDGKKEIIYMFSNAFDDRSTSDKAFTYVVIEKNDKYQVIYEDVREASEIYNICVPYLQAVIDLRKNKKYTLIFGCEYYSEIGTSSIVYGEQNSKYKTLLK